MTNLSGRSVVLVRVLPDQFEEASREIEKMPNVERVWPVLGSYDLLVTAGFPDYISLRDFVGSLRSRPFVSDCKVHPNFWNWEREGVPETPVTGWVFIDTTDFNSTLEGLKRISNVNHVISTTGDYNLIANLGVEEFREYGTILRKNVLTIPGVRNTETYTHTPE
jgi:DNA-binding Lrp family transcriptional regulator